MSNPMHAADGDEAVARNTAYPSLDRRDTFASKASHPTAATASLPELERRSTFARTMTFNPQAFNPVVYEGYVAQTIKKTITTFGETLDPDAVYTNALLEEYNKHDDGNEGDLPLQTGFARKAKFWRVFLLVCLLASFMSLVAAGFVNLTQEVPKKIVRCKYDDDPDCGFYYRGQKWWIAYSGGCGLLVGLIRYFLSYPTTLPGIFKDIQDFHVDPNWAPITFCLSAISLCGGATLGPEQALGNVGGGIATWVTENLHENWFSDEEYKQLFILAGMAAPLGALLQAPVLGTMMIHELGQPPKTFMESTTLLSLSCAVCFVIYYELAGVSFIEHLSNNTALLSYDWVKDDGYEDWQIGTGFICGVISATLCFMVLVTIGITKQVFNRIRLRLSHNLFLKEVVPPLVGGIIIGTVNWALPGTYGNGELVNAWIVKSEVPSSGVPTIGTDLLIYTALGRMFLLGVSMNCGFIGGIIYPFLTMGSIVGVIAYKMHHEVPLGLFVSVFMVGLPSGIVPMPMTFVSLVCFLFFFGFYQTIPVFVACVTSYSIVCSSGLMKGLVVRAQQREKADKEANEKKSLESNDRNYVMNNNTSGTSGHVSERYAVDMYLGSKKKFNNNREEEN